MSGRGWEATAQIEAQLCTEMVAELSGENSSQTERATRLSCLYENHFFLVALMDTARRIGSNELLVAMSLAYSYAWIRAAMVGPPSIETTTTRPTSLARTSSASSCNKDNMESIIIGTISDVTLPTKV
jgi:hypothetical protein